MPRESGGSLPDQGSLGVPTRAGRDGYNVMHWEANAMSFAAVSDLDSSGLEDFIRDWRQAP
ncbi:MAG: hypothetical protein WAU49_11275 [Steroidobacteraceae bacterium]